MQSEQYSTCCSASDVRLRAILLHTLIKRIDRIAQEGMESDNHDSNRRLCLAEISPRYVPFLRSGCRAKRLAPYGIVRTRPSWPGPMGGGRTMGWVANG